MDEQLDRAVAVVGVGAIMPDAPDAPTFWHNIRDGRYSITDVDPLRWDPDLYYDPDPKAPDKTYSKVGGWVRDWDWDPRAWKLPLMPRVADAMDDTQKWALACTHQALTDYGYPERALDNDRVAVVLGNAMGGEGHYETALRVAFPEIAEQLGQSPGFGALSSDVQRAITAELHDIMGKRYPEITEDTMPGELSNCIAGRVANLYNLRGPNYVVDAACASAMAAAASAVDGLVAGDYDAVVTGGIDRNMGASTYIKFCKIGALSATGTRPYADGADGFVMGEGAAVFLLKRLNDAVRNGDRIYAVLRGVAGSSDGRGKGITAPNPVGQKLSVLRAWRNAGLAPQTASLVEGHGTSTRVGDVVEHESMAEVFGGSGVAPGSIALGSVKSNIGHLKSGAGAAGVFKAVMALSEKVLPPSLNFVRPNPNIDFSLSPFRVNTELREWETPECGVRRAGVSAFGFGGTNFHAVLEEYSPERHNGDARVFAVPEKAEAGTATGTTGTERPAGRRGIAVIGGADEHQLGERLARVTAEAEQGRVPAAGAPAPADLAAAERVAIDFADAADLADKAGKAQRALSGGDAAWKLLRGRGVFRGSGPAAKVAFLYTGQGSQYPNMLRGLAESEPTVAEIFAQADGVMAPLLDGHRLTEYLFVDPDDAAAVAQAEQELRRTEITQPAVLTVDHALDHMLQVAGFHPDFVMGHSLGEYAALVASGALPFEEALVAVSARGREMSVLELEDKGLMAAVFAPLDEVVRIVDAVDGNVVIANINSMSQAVIGGATTAVEQAMADLSAADHHAILLPVSHAFHTSIVAPASEPLKATLARLRLAPPQIPVVANVSGDFYPTGPDVVPEMLDILGRQVASPVQFVRGLRTLYDNGARVFVEVGPKKALHGFVEDVLGAEPGVTALFTNHPKWEDEIALNQARAGLYAAGVGAPAAAVGAPVAPAPSAGSSGPSVAAWSAETAPPTAAGTLVPAENHEALGRLVADFLGRTVQIDPAGARPARPARPVVITGAALGLPGTERMFDPSNIGRLLRGEQCIKSIPVELRDAILDQHITRLVKRDDGAASFETIDSAAEVIKLAGRAHAFDVGSEFGVGADRLPALDHTTQMAIAAGFDALNDAGVPLVMHYKTTHIGTQLPERWGLPDELRDDTGVIFASAFPGMDSFAGHAREYYEDRARHEQLAALRAVQESLVAANGDAPVPVAAELDRRIVTLEAEIEAKPYRFERRFLFRVLSMGHSQFAEIIGARGPNTQVNSACASTTQAIAIAEDWIRAGRCRRVIVVAADDVTSDNLLGWVGAGFLASGAAATDEAVEDAAMPFDRRRHGMILGMGAAAIVVEAAEAADERGLQPICELLSAVTANSAFHGTRLDVDHISELMQRLVGQAEQRWGIDRHSIAAETVFVSHETFTPARGGSAAAEVFALRSVFGDSAGAVVMANTKGYTGHPMGVGIEDVVAVKALETGLIPPIANYKEPDPDLGPLNLSTGGSYPVRYALRLAAGFGSQISMTLLRWVPTLDGVRRSPEELGYDYRIVDRAQWSSWLARVSGQSSPELEVVQHRLRVVDNGPAQTEPGIAITADDDRSAPAELEPVDAPGHVVADEVPESPPAAGAAPPPVAEPASANSSGPAATAAGAVLVADAALAPPTVDEVQERVLAVVVEQTGYPRDMLDLDLDLEADLGIDTVKQAELFASVRDTYGIPRDANLKLRDFPTLDSVIHFVLDRAPVYQSVPPAAADFSAGQAAMAAGVTPAEIAKATAPDAAASAALDEGEVRERVLAVVVEQTGYPRDMLDLDLDLEADLGIDTVKQAELFASVRETYGIARDANLKLRDFPTLDSVIHFVLDRAGAGQPSTSAPAAPAAPVAPADVPAAPDGPAAVPDEPVGVDEGEVRERVLSVVVEQTGYPRDMLDLDLDLEADLGIDTVKQAELFASVRDTYGIPRDANLKLRDFPTLDSVIHFVLDRAGAGQPSTAAPPAPAAPEAPADVPAASGGPAVVDEDEVRERVLAVVVEQTGYPRDMLDLDLDLEADLGIDTVKQAELFASVRETYGIPRDANLKLRDFPTLDSVIHFVLDRAGAAQPSTDAPAAPVAPATRPPAAETVADPAAAIATMRPEALENLEPCDRVTRRVPVPVLRPPLDMCRTSGVGLTTGDRVLVVPDQGGVADALVERLQARGVEPLVVDVHQMAAAQAVADALEPLLAGGPIVGVYWLPALDAEPPLDQLDLAGWRTGLQVRVKSLAATMRVLYDAIAAPDTFLISGTRLGGRHGFDAAGAGAPLGGAVTGFTKAYGRERPDCLVKAVDVEARASAANVADALVEETLRDPGAVEIGRADGLRLTVGLEDQPVTDGNPGFPLGAESVFVVTGAAGSIVSTIISDLATASGGSFHLLDLAPEPDPDDADLDRFVSDPDGLKRDLFERIKARGDRATPVLVDRELAGIERRRAALDAIRAVQAAGGEAIYHQLDLRDADAVGRALDVVRQRHGRVDVLLHAGGLEISRTLPDKTDAEFELVFDVKSDGWFNVLAGVGDMPLGATVCFSSVAGRFGNAGQTDYSAASDLLAKTTSSFRSTRPATRGIVIDWTAWGGIGMATRGSIPKMMALAGIDMLDPEAGIPWIRRELVAGGRTGEVLVAGELGVLTNELDAGDVLDRAALARITPAGPMAADLTAMGVWQPVTVETVLDPSMQGFLDHHRIDGTPVLPGVMGVEAFAEAASLVAPGWRVTAVEEVEFLAPFKFYRNQPRAVVVNTMVQATRADELVAPCQLLGARLLPGSDEPQVTTHFIGRVRLTRGPEAPVVVSSALPAVNGTGGVGADAIYGVYFHGPTYQVLERSWFVDEHQIGLMASGLPDNHRPPDLPLVTAPRLLELCFQTAGVWELTNSGRLALPQRVGLVTVAPPSLQPSGRVRAIVSPVDGGTSFSAEVVDETGQVLLRMEDYRTIVLPDPVEAGSLDALRVSAG